MKTVLILSAAMLLAAPAFADDFNLAPSSGHQPVKAQVTDSTPSHFTIDLKKAANLGVNQKAKTFAIYTGGKVPAQCGDFSKLSINYQKPDKYHRIFNLAQKPEVLTALDEYGCVIIPNKPAMPPAKS